MKEEVEAAAVAATQEDSPRTVIIQNNTNSNAIGIASFVFGVISIFMLSIIFVPLAVILGIVAIIKKQLLWGGLGLVCATIGFITSPILLGLLGLASVAANQ